MLFKKKATNKASQKKSEFLWSLVCGFFLKSILFSYDLGFCHPRLLSGTVCQNKKLVSFTLFKQALQFAASSKGFGSYLVYSLQRSKALNSKTSSFFLFKSSLNLSTWFLLKINNKNKYCHHKIFCDIL